MNIKQLTQNFDSSTIEEFNDSYDVRAILLKFVFGSTNNSYKNYKDDDIVNDIELYNIRFPSSENEDLNFYNKFMRHNLMISIDQSWQYYKNNLQSKKKTCIIS